MSSAVSAMSVSALCGRVLGGVDVPADHERQLRIGLHAAGADLAPLEVEAIGAATVAGHGVATHALLDLGHVVDREAPAEPAAAGVGTLAYGLAERGLVGGGVVEDFDNFEVLVVLERQDHVARAESGVRAAVDEGGTEQLCRALAVVPARPSAPTAKET